MINNIKFSIWRSKIGGLIFRTVMYLLLIGVAYICLFPFLFMLITSLKSYPDLLDPAVNWIPKSLKFSNFKIAFETIQYPRYFLNSLILTAGSTIGHVLSAAAIGYGFARYRFRGRNILYIFVILSIVVPVQTLLIPTYITVINFKWIDTYLPIIIPAFFGFGLKGGMFVFLSSQYMRGIPKELEEAAKIDGCNFLSTFINIVIPVAKPLLLIISVLSVVWHWNDITETGFYLSNKAMLPLPINLSALELAINQMKEVQNSPSSAVTTSAAELFFSDYNVATLMAGTLLVTLPLILFFAYIQKSFVQSVERSGLVG